MYTIIIPVFNSSAYLQKCIDSVLGQSCKDFELLLINDGSTDNSGSICDSYAQKDHRIRVFHEINQGVAASRNLGIANAVGDWIIFIDSDDFIEKDYLLSISDIINNNNIDCEAVVLPTKKDKPLQKEVVIIDEAFLESGVYDTDIFLESVQLFFKMAASVYSKIYKKSIIEKYKIQFMNTNLFEDGIFNLQYFEYTKHIYYYNLPFYHYVIYTNRPSLSRLSLRAFNNYITTAAVLYKLINEISEIYNINKAIYKNAYLKANRMLSLGYYTLYTEQRSYLERRSLMEKYSQFFVFYSKYYANYKYKLFLIFVNKNIPYFIKDVIMKILYLLKFK